MTNPNPNSKVPDEEHSMASDEPMHDRCNEEVEDDLYCMRFPALSENGEEIYEDGKCYFCAGGEKQHNRATHGLYSKRSQFFKRLSPHDQAKVDELILEMIDESPYDRDNKLMCEQIRRVGIDIAKIWYGNEYIAEKGMAQKKTVDVDDEGYPIKEDVENIMNIPIDRLERSINNRMKDYGIITEDPESRKADEMKTLAEVLSE